jgi:hypothetical protein
VGTLTNSLVNMKTITHILNTILFIIDCFALYYLLFSKSNISPIITIAVTLLTTYLIIVLFYNFNWIPFNKKQFYVINWIILLVCTLLVDYVSIYQYLYSSNHLSKNYIIGPIILSIGLIYNSIILCKMKKDDKII